MGMLIIQGNSLKKAMNPHLLQILVKVLNSKLWDLRALPFGVSTPLKTLISCFSSMYNSSGNISPIRFVRIFNIVSFLQNGHKISLSILITSQIFSNYYRNINYLNFLLFNEL